MSDYVFDPAWYFGDEGELPSSANPLAQLEFGAPASAPQATGSAAYVNRAAMHSTAPAQTTDNRLPLHDVNTRGTLWLGLGITTLVVTVCMRRNGPFYWA
jgi:hypothetical protein